MISGERTWLRLVKLLDLGLGPERWREKIGELVTMFSRFKREHAIQDATGKAAHTRRPSWIK